MSKTIVSILALVVGLVVGWLGGMTFGTGVGAGAGVATGLSSGICMTVKAAQDKGFVTAEQVDEVMTQASANLSEATTGEIGEIAGTAAQCDAFLAKLKEAAAK